MSLQQINYKQIKGAPINASAYGMLPSSSGVTNATALQTAINLLSSNGGVVYIPTGNYTIDGTITFPNNKITLLGDGGIGYEYLTQRGTTLSFINATIGFDLTSASSTGTFNSCIRDLLINGNNLLDTGIKSSRSLSMHNVGITGCLNIGLWLYDWTIATNLVECAFYYNGDVDTHTGIGVKIASSDGISITTIHFDKCVFDRNEKGIVIENTSGASFKDCIIESNYGAGLIIDAFERGDGYAAVNLVNFSSCHFEGNALGTPISAAYSIPIIIQSQGAVLATNVGAEYVSFVNCSLGEQTTVRVSLTNGNYITFDNCLIYAPYQPVTGITAYNFNIDSYVKNTTINNTLTPFTVPTPSTNPGIGGQVYIQLNDTGINTSVVNGGPSITTSWTPEININGVSTGITYSTNMGTYIKNGDLIYISGYIALSNKGAVAGDLTIINLPFEIEPSSYGVINFAYVNSVTLSGILVGRINASSIVLENQLFAGAGAIKATNAAITNASIFMFSGSYIARATAANGSRLI